MNTAIVEGFVATTGPTKAYGGVRIAESVLETIKEAFESGTSKFQAHHDARNPMYVKVHRVEIRAVEGGEEDERGVWVQLEVDEDEWKSHGDIRGFSFSGIEPFVRAPSTPTGRPRLSVAADPRYFDDAALKAAANALAPYFDAATSRLYQFSIGPPPNVIVDFALAFLQSLPNGIAANALYDVLKTYFLKPKDTDQQSVVTFSAHDGDRRIDATVETSDPAILQEAMAGLQDLAHTAGDAFGWDKAERRWLRRK